MTALLRVLLLVACLFAAPTASAVQPVDVDLVLAIDCSSSVTPEEYILQMEGFAAAFRDPQVIEAIKGLDHGAIAVTVVQWSYARWQQVVIPWTIVHDAGSASGLAEAFTIAPRIVYGGETSISAAIDVAAGLLDARPQNGQRRVIDISGDGSNNQGRSVTAARDQAVARNIVINGLTILHEEPDLEDYYRRSVIGGPGAFVMPAADYAAFGAAIRQKLLREITAPVAMLPGPAGHARGIGLP